MDTKPRIKIDKIRAKRAKKDVSETNAQKHQRGQVVHSIKVFERGFGGKLFTKSFQPNGTLSEGTARML